MSTIHLNSFAVIRHLQLLHTIVREEKQFHSLNSLSLHSTKHTIAKQLKENEGKLTSHVLLDSCDDNKPEIFIVIKYAKLILSSFSALKRTFNMT